MKKFVLFCVGLITSTQIFAQVPVDIFGAWQRGRESAERANRSDQENYWRIQQQQDQNLYRRIQNMRTDPNWEKIVADESQVAYLDTKNILSMSMGNDSIKAVRYLTESSADGMRYWDIYYNCDARQASVMSIQTYDNGGRLLENLGGTGSINFKPIRAETVGEYVFQKVCSGK